MADIVKFQVEEMAHVILEQSFNSHRSKREKSFSWLLYISRAT